MLLVEPPRNQYDLCFALFGIPVRVHPFFWLVALLLGLGGVNHYQDRAQALLIWIVVIFISILLHELGHAFAIRYYGWEPSVTLYALGGMATHHRG